MYRLWWPLLRAWLWLWLSSLRRRHLISRLRGRLRWCLFLARWALTLLVTADVEAGLFRLRGAARGTRVAGVLDASADRAPIAITHGFTICPQDVLAPGSVFSRAACLPVRIAS